MIPFIMVKIKVLLENNRCKPGIECEHGLSLHMESGGWKILFDTGAGGKFAENARKMNVALEEVDIAFISHGHSDHGGGLEKFLEINDKAPVYIHRQAFEEYYAAFLFLRTYIGLNKRLRASSRFVFTHENLVLDNGLEIFTGVTGTQFMPPANARLRKKQEETLVPDDFTHEQNLIIRENGNIILVSGCAHKGIVNILEKFQRAKRFLPSHVIGGLHLSGASEAFIRRLGRYLESTGIKFYTCHCTGKKAYMILKEIMGSNIDYISGGMELEI